MSDYKHTLNLPETAFPMRGNLAKREPDMLQRWQDLDVYGNLRKQREGGISSSSMMALPTPMAAFISVMRSIKSSRI